MGGWYRLVVRKRRGGRGNGKMEGRRREGEGGRETKL